MTVPTVVWSVHTDVGRVRERNEDAAGGDLRVDGAGAARGFFVVCDGMGGHAGGAHASTLAVDVLRGELAWALAERWPEAGGLSERVEDALRAAHAAIAARNDALDAGGRERAGTTAVLLLLSGRQAWVAHVGDSRAYLVTRGETVQLTADHNVATREVNRGEKPEEIWARPDARQLTQALGPIPTEHLRPTVTSLAVQQDSLFVLCTDGLSDGGFVEAHDADLLRPLLGAGTDLQAGGRALIARAREVNGHDNLTALLVRVAGLGGDGRARTTDPRPEAVTRQAPGPTGWLSRMGFGRRS
jgi:protein phosphatase